VTHQETVFVPTGSAVASISFETTNSQEFMHVDFTPNNTVRIDDTVEFGSFVRNQVFLVQVTLNISTTQSAAHVGVSGSATHAIQTAHVQWGKKLKTKCQLRRTG
jgi:hypothetical protein